MLPFKNFKTKLALQCNDPIEASYYGKHRLTKQYIKKLICSRCYMGGVMVSDDEIEETRDTGGLHFLPLCRKCFDEGVPLVKNGKKRNFLTKSKEDKKKKEELFEKYVQKGMRKSRKDE